jgi:3-oxoadipate enol-lactonase
MPSCQLSNAMLFYAERGQGEPLVFLNGLSGDHLYWGGQLRFFSKRFRAIAVDNRDVGQSSYAEASYTSRDLAGDVAEFLEHHLSPQPPSPDRRGGQGGEVQPAHVVGLSMGGMIAQELALARPELVKSLVLVNTLARADHWFKGTINAFGLIRRQVGTTAAFFAGILPWWVSHRFLEESERTSWLLWLLQQNPHDQRLDGFLRQLEVLSGHDALDRLGGIRCPVLILAGEDDGVSPARYSHQMKERLPQAELVALPGVGHAAPIENPGQFNRLLQEFLLSVTSAQ